ncbi:MAG: hypothetical protein SW833_24790 [Cyanobacteriota bacterium]|nr:hypothetical protein [Cyanobacteriota bacterium]
MFNPIAQLSPKFLLAPFAVSLVLGSFGAMEASAQVIIYRDRIPTRTTPQFRRNGLYYRNPVIQSSPHPSDYYPGNSRRIRRHTVIDQQPYPSGTNVFINPTVVIPGGYGSRYPYPVRNHRGSSIYYGSPSGFQIQIGY